MQSSAQSINDIKKQIHDDQLRRYSLSVVSNQEFIVIENLKERIKKQNLENDIVDSLVPQIEEIIVKHGKKSKKMTKLYPGYVFVRCRMNEKIRYVIRNTPGVRLIVGADTRPIPLTDDEYMNIIAHVQAHTLSEKVLSPFSKWDIVIVKDANFMGMKGKVVWLDSLKHTVIVSIDMLGRSTPVTLWYDKIALVN
jgi:transcriptional antiterminator NusG